MIEKSLSLIKLFTLSIILLILSNFISFNHAQAVTAASGTPQGVTVSPNGIATLNSNLELEYAWVINPMPGGSVNTSNVYSTSGVNQLNLNGKTITFKNSTTTRLALAAQSNNNVGTNFGVITSGSNIGLTAGIAINGAGPSGSFTITNGTITNSVQGIAFSLLVANTGASNISVNLNGVAVNNNAAGVSLSTKTVAIACGFAGPWNANILNCNLTGQSGLWIANQLVISNQNLVTGAPNSTSNIGIHGTTTISTGTPNTTNEAALTGYGLSTGNCNITIAGSPGDNVTITGSSSSSNAAAGVYLPDAETTTTIGSGATVTGYSGVVLRGGVLRVTGNASITGEGAYTTDLEPGGKTGPGSGSGVVVVPANPNAEGYYGGGQFITEGDPTISSDNGYGYESPAPADDQKSVIADVQINGGTFEGEKGSVIQESPSSKNGPIEGFINQAKLVPALSSDQSNYVEPNTLNASCKVGNTDVSVVGSDINVVESLLNELEDMLGEPGEIVNVETEDSKNIQIPDEKEVSAVSLGDNFLNYYQLASSTGTYPAPHVSQYANTNNLDLTILPTTAFANSLDWTITSLSGNTNSLPSFKNSEWVPGGVNWLTQLPVMSIISDDGDWAIQQDITPSQTNPDGSPTPGNTYLSYNGDDDLQPGLYELTASAITGRGSDSIRFIVTANTVTNVNIVKPQGQGNPVTFDISDQSYDFEFETTPPDAAVNVVKWKLDISGGSNYKAGDYAYVNPETGNMTFLQATPQGVYLELSVTVNGVTSSPMIIQLTGDWAVETGIKPFVNPVTVQSTQAYDLSSNIVANPTNVPIGNTSYLSYVVTPETDVILTPAGKLIPKNTNYSGTVTVQATYKDGTTPSTTTFNVIFTPRAVAATGVTAAPALSFVTGDLTTQNVNAGLTPLGTVQGSTYQPGTTAQITPLSFIYETSDPSVAVVDSFGNVKAVTEGTATITTTLIDAEKILTVPSGQQLSDIEAVETQVTVTNTPTQVPATGITVEPNSPIYLSPTNVEDGTHEQTVTVTVTPENTTDSVTAESGNTGVATVTGEGNSFTVSAVSDGNTTVTFTAGSAKATVQVSVNSEEIISSGLTFSANSPDTFSITAGGVMVNPAIPGIEGTPVDNVTFMAWSGPDQGDMQTFTVNSSGNESFSSETFSINGNDRYFYNADNIFVEAYANNSQVYLGSLSPNYDWINTSTAGSNDTVAYITYQENNGFNTPTVFNGATSGVTGKNLQLEGIRVSSNIEGVDVVTDVHLQDLGWVEAVNDGVYAGTQHQARQMEAIRLRLVGDNAINYDIWAQGHVENTGWMQPVKLGNNVDFIGTTGKALQLEAVKIQIVPKGQNPSGWEAY